MANKKICEVCEERPLRYKLYLDEDVICPHCDYAKYAKKSEKLFVCSTQCPDLYWQPIEYLSKKNEKITKVRYVLEKDECFNCGKRDFPEALFIGERLDPQPDIEDFMFDGKININPSAFMLPNRNIDPITIEHPCIKIYLPKIEVDKQCEPFYVAYYMTLKSKKGFTMSRLCHAAYQLLINSIDDIFNGKNVWKNDKIKGISFNEKTLSAFIVIDN
jgi:hypothetical protein